LGHMLIGPVHLMQRNALLVERWDNTEPS